MSSTQIVFSKQAHDKIVAGATILGDMIEMGVLDPTKVARNALLNAASVAGLILTTDCMVAEKPRGDLPATGTDDGF